MKDFKGKIRAPPILKLVPNCSSIRSQSAALLLLPFGGLRSTLTEAQNPGESADREREQSKAAQ